MCHDQLFLAFVFICSPEQTHVLFSLSLQVLSSVHTLLIVSVPLSMPYLAKTKQSVTMTNSSSPPRSRSLHHDQLLLAFVFLCSPERTRLYPPLTNVPRQLPCCFSPSCSCSSLSVSPVSQPSESKMQSSVIAVCRDQLPLAFVFQCSPEKTHLCPPLTDFRHHPCPFSPSCPPLLFISVPRLAAFCGQIEMFCDCRVSRPTPVGVCISMLS